MTNKKFSANNTALLLIDHQVGTMQLIKNIDREFAAKQSIALAKMAKILNIPTVITSSQTVPKVQFCQESLKYCPKPMRHGSNAQAWSTPGPIRISAMRCLPQDART